jgi:4-diphosphocytidyl-2C-methyl-D-erythritol kinase
VKEGKTAALYGLLRAEHFTDGSVALALAEAIRRGEPPGETLLFNTFERVAHEAYPALAQYQAALLAAGGLPRGTVHLAGSGPILFALAPSRQEGQGWASRLKARGIAAHLVATVVPGQGLPTG